MVDCRFVNAEGSDSVAAPERGDLSSIVAPQPSINNFPGWFQSSYVIPIR